MATKKMISVVEKSFLTVASLTVFLSTDRVVAKEICSIGNYSQASHYPLDVIKVNSVDFLESKSTVYFTGERSERFNLPLAGIGQSTPLPVPQTIKSKLKSRSERSISPQLSILYNPDLTNLVNRSSLSGSLAQTNLKIPGAKIDGQQLIPKSSKTKYLKQLSTSPNIAQTSVPKTVPPAPEVEELVRQINTSLSPTASSTRYTPAISFVTPIGFGGYFGNVGIGAAYQSSTALGNKDDGNFGATVSLGNPSKFVGIDLTFTVNSISNDANRGGGGNLGSNTLTLQLSRLLADDWSIGVGAENLISFDSRNISTTKSYYFATTKIFPLNRDRNKLFSTLYTSIGVGNGRFLPAGKVTVQGEPGVNVFGSAAVQVIDGINGIVEWSGQDLDLAISVIPFKNIPLAITPAVVDLVGTSQNRGARFNISVGYAFNF